MDIYLDPINNDIEFIKGKPLIDEGFQTAVFISLFTDARAEDDDNIPDRSNDRRGFWGDAIEDEPLGSRLWLLSRSKINSDTIALIEKYSLEALQWMIDDGIVTLININVEKDIVDRERINWEIELVKPNGITERVSYSSNWTAQEVRRNAV